MLCAEYIAGNHSRGEVLLFQRAQKKQIERKVAQDEETGMELRAPGGHNEPGSQKEKRIHLQEQRGVLHWKDVCYEVLIKGTPRVISDHIDGWVKPGTLTALMVCLPRPEYFDSIGC